MRSPPFTRIWYVCVRFVCTFGLYIVCMVARTHAHIVKHSYVQCTRSFCVVLPMILSHVITYVCLVHSLVILCSCLSCQWTRVRCKIEIFRSDQHTTLEWPSTAMWAAIFLELNVQVTPSRKYDIYFNFNERTKLNMTKTATSTH